MCLSGIQYYINLRSDALTQVSAQTTGEYHHRYAFNWNSFLRDLPHNTKYFKVKVNFFWNLKHGIDANAVAIHCPQMESPYIYSFPREMGNPLCYARPDGRVDVDNTGDEKMSNTRFYSDSSSSDGQTVCIRRDAFIDIIIRDPTGVVDNKSVIATYKDANDTIVPLPDYNIQLVIEPYLDTDKKESECKMKGNKAY